MRELLSFCLRSCLPLCLSFCLCSCLPLSLSLCLSFCLRSCLPYYTRRTKAWTDWWRNHSKTRSGSMRNFQGPRAHAHFGMTMTTSTIRMTTFWNDKLLLNKKVVETLQNLSDYWCFRVNFILAGVLFIETKTWIILVYKQIFFHYIQLKLFNWFISQMKH